MLPNIAFLTIPYAIDTLDSLAVKLRIGETMRPMSSKLVDHQMFK